MVLKELPNDPRDLNNILLDKWGVSLFRFAQVFAISPADLIIHRNDYPFSKKEILLTRRNLKAMRENLLGRGRIIYGITKKLLGPSAKVMTDEELIKHMRLEGFFKQYVQDHEKVIDYASKISLMDKRGRSINHKAIIAVGWGNLISGKNRKMDWKTLGLLYNWFWTKVSNHGFYEELEPKGVIEEYLRHQYNRYRWNHEKILERAGFKRIGEVLQFVSSMFSHKLLGDKTDYLRKKLSLSASEFPKFYLNFVVDYYLAGRDGLTILAPDQAVADPGYKFLDLSRGKKVGSKGYLRLLAWMYPKGTDLLRSQELPYQDTRIKEYLSCAGQLYADHRISLDHPTPLIIFPDKSFFSISF